MTYLTWYGHSAFKIEADGASVLIDPFFAPKYGFGPADVGNVDIVLVSHDHGDHVGDAVQICKQTGAMLGCIVGTAGKLEAQGIPAAQILNGIGYNIGGTISHKGFAMTMTQAFHSSESGAPAGFIIRTPDNLVFYHAGDTGIFTSMKELAGIYGIQIALLPIGGVFTMDGLQAANAALLLQCRVVVPMHWGTFPVLAQSTDEFKKQLQKLYPSCVCPDLQPGQKYDCARLLDV